jgi:hypothetical protein
MKYALPACVNDSVGVSLACSFAPAAEQTTSEQTSANDRASWRAEQEELKDIGIAGVYQTFFNSGNRLI